MIWLWCLLALFLFVTCYLLWFQKFSRFSKLLHKIPGPPGYPIFGTISAYRSIPQDFAGIENVHLFKDTEYELREIYLFLAALMPEVVFLETLFDGMAKIRRRYYPVYKDWTFVFGMVHLQHPDDVEIILSSTELINKGWLYSLLQPWLGTGLLTSGGKKWHARRKVLTPAFHFSILQDFVKVFNEGTEKLVDDLLRICHQPSIDVIPLITEFTLSSIAESSMGLKMDATDDSCRQYKQTIHSLGELLVYRLFRPWLRIGFIFSMFPSGRRHNEYIKILHAFSRNVIKKRKEKKEISGGSYSSRKRIAMLDLLLSAKEQGFNIDDEGIREEVDTFMFEGHDTTAVALCYVLLLLANHASVQEEIHKEIVDVLADRVPNINDLKEMTYMERCLKECLRLYPSVPMISRMITKEVKTASGYVIPVGASANVFIYDLHRDPEYFPNPEKFDPDRFLPEATKNRHPFAYVPFSAGPRNCIGQRFAMLELKSALCGILRRFKLEPVDTTETVSIKTDLVLRPQGSIRIRFKHRS